MTAEVFANVLVLGLLWAIFAGPLLERVVGLALGHYTEITKYVARLCIDVFTERLFELFLLLLAAQLVGLPVLDGMGELIKMIFA